MLLNGLIFGLSVGHFHFVVGGIFNQQQENDFSDSKCTNLVCEQAHEQAKGLSKLALLDEFVSQTVYLLNDLMKNIDGELEKSADSLLWYIHPHCDPTRKILEEVIRKQREKIVKGPVDLSKDVSPMTEQDLGNVEPHGDYDVVRQFHDEDGLYENSMEEDNEFHEEKLDHSYGSSSIYQTSGGDHQTYEGFSNSRNPSTGRNLEKGWSKHESTTTNSWIGSNKKPYNSREDGEKSSWHDSKFYVPHKNEKTTSSKGKTLTSKDNQTKSISHNEGCRGVNKGSTFWTPGLDNWCKNNCLKGYCPKTHCIC